MSAATPTPTNAAEAGEALAAALAAGQRVEIVGQGSKRGFGHAVDADVVLSTAKLTGLGLYEPEELVMSAAPGTPIAEIERTLADSNQHLEFEPPDLGPLYGLPAGQGTIGGAFAGNLAGPRRIRVGAARDHLLGVHLVTGRGEPIKSGGRVVKNVTGYDLPKVMCGSFGTLALITHVTFKAMPRPETGASLALSGLPRAELLKALRTAMASPYDIASTAYVSAEALNHSGSGLAAPNAGVALIRIEGTEPSVRYRLERARDLLASGGAELAVIEAGASDQLWRELRDATLVNAAAADAPLWKLSVAPSAADAVLDGLANILHPAFCADWSGGLIWAAYRGAAEDAGAAEIRRVIAAHGGSATLMRAPEAVRARVPVFTPQSAPVQALSQRLKASFDPDGRLNPGKLQLQG